MNHSVSHFEIPADEPEKLADFYRELFGWQIDKVPGDAMEYWVVHTMPTDDKGMILEPGGINGGLMPRMAPEQRPLNYVMVESVDDYLAKAQALGAQVSVGKMPVPGMGWFAHLVDPQGNAFAIFQDDTTVA